MKKFRGAFRKTATFLLLVFFLFSENISGQAVSVKSEHCDGDWKLACTSIGDFVLSHNESRLNAIVVKKGAPESIRISNGGNVGIGVNPQSKLHVEGTTTTKVLEITGGGDIAEPFDVDQSEGAKPGMVLCIDSNNPGQLQLSRKAYDRKVAGIVSGANGVNPGLTLKQAGSVVDGSLPVALSGRVYCWVDASKNPVEPGDMLTTSDVPGYAMKVDDYAQSHGAIIGKAMSSLASGRGLVLVLVTLH